MQTTNTVWYGIGAFVFLLILTGGGYVIKDRYFTESKPAPKPAVDVAPKPANTSQQPVSSIPLQVQGTNTPNTPTTPQLPTPDQFKTYEQYASATTTQFIDTQVGAGASAAQGDTVAVLYSGWLTNGTLFDQTRTNEKGQLVAFSFTLGARQVISGWEQGILGMKEGGKRRLIVPSSLGYGSAGQGETIPPNSMLIFDVELVKVSKLP